MEFKRSFNFANWWSYARTMAAFANCRGGHIVFGVSNNPRELVGLTTDAFERRDPADMEDRLTGALSPALDWDHDTFEFEGKLLGYIAVRVSARRPVVCSKTQGSDLKEGEIYYRYHGQTKVIGYTELQRIIDERISNERQALMSHVKLISEVGPTNVGILDTVDGKISGFGPPLLVDERLLKQIQFVREGRFVETEGEPTLRLIGEVRYAGDVVGMQSVPLAVGYSDVINRFLQGGDLDEQFALAYLKAALDQQARFLPYHYFVSQTGKSVQEVIELLVDADESAVRDKQKKRDRLLRRSLVQPLGAVDAGFADDAKFKIGALFTRNYQSASVPKAKRTTLAGHLTHHPQTVLEALDLVDEALLSEAVTNLHPDVVVLHADAFRTILSMAYRSNADRYRTEFRKALCHIDECLYVSS